MPKLFLIPIAFLLFLGNTFAQSYSIAGNLKSIDKKPVGFASVALSRTTDTSVVHFAVANENGDFRLKGIKNGNYFLVIACMGFEVEHYPLKVIANKKGLEIFMTPSTLSFKEVMVSAKKIPILINGDTVVYNSSSFKTQSNANVEDLIKKMPGIQVSKDGSISAEGQTITKVLINGKEFFGGNVTAATKNLDAALVDKVEVIEKKSDEDEFTGDDANEREKVINLVLKEDKAQGYFGTIRAGYGSNNYYDGHGNVNFFKDETQLSVIGGLNNIDRGLYGWEAMSTLNTFEIKPFNGRRNSRWFNGGVKTYIGAGANLHFEPVKGMKADVAYVLTNEQAVKTGNRSSEVYLTENTLFSKSREESNSDRENHQVNAKIEYQPDTLNRIVFRGQFSKQMGNANNGMRTFNFINSNAIVNSGVNKDEVEDGNQKAISKIHWTKKSKRKSDNHLIASVYVGYSDADNNYDSYFKTDTFLLDFPSNEMPLINQQLSTNEKTLATTTGYQFQLNNRWMIRPGFNYMVSEYNHTFNWTENDGNKVLDKSPYGSVKAQNLEYYMHISYKLDSFTTLYVVPEINQTIERRDFTTDQTYKYDFNQAFFIPYMFIRSNKPHKYNFRFNVRANLQKPQINQIMPVVDNSNPYKTNIGNIELQNNMNYRNGWHYRRMLGLGKSIRISGWNSLAIRPVINNNSVSSDNYAISEVINLKNKIYSNNSIEFTWPLNALKAQFDLAFDYNYGQAYFIQNDIEILSQNNGFSFGPGIQFNEFDKWSLDLDYQVNWKTGNIAGVANNGYAYHEIDAEFVLTPIKRFEWSSSLYMEVYGSNNAVGEAVIPILSSEASFFIDKHQQWSLGVRAYDILNKNQNLWRWWSSNSFVQSESNAITRYVMGTLTYKIKKQSSGAGHNGPVDRRRMH